jgi:tRNA wybutosine-synthesizing protein 1
MGDRTKTLEKHKYKSVGGHSAVKLCWWMRQKLYNIKECYKETFYGIKTHRCLQMSPMSDLCNQNCLFCWRYQNWGMQEGLKYDSPEDILDGCIQQQKKLLTGFKGDSRCNLLFWKEAQEPTQVAISLSGEPTLYPFLGDFIALCNKRGMTTFLVTNGTTPKALENLSCLPTQLYISIVAPNKEIYKKLCLPTGNGNKQWENILETLALIPSLDTRVVIRHTLVKNWNLGWEEQYAQLDKIANPTLIEPKGYVYLGQSRRRLSRDDWPYFDDVLTFSNKLREHLGLELLAQRKDSMVTVLGEKSITLKIK